MEPDKQADVPEENGDTYTPLQRFALKIMRWGAWISAFVAMMIVMHS